MSGRSKRQNDHDDRLAEAQGAAHNISEQEETVISQLSLVDRLTKGWRRVHETNHLAQLFRDEGRLG